LNEKNLIPAAHKFTVEERSRAGRKSGEARRKKRDMKAKMKLLLELPCQNCSDFNNASELGIDIEEIDNEMVLLVGLFNRAKTGDVQAIREIRNIAGIDIPSAELEIRKKELKLKEESMQKNEPTHAEEEPLLYKALGADEE